MLIIPAIDLMDGQVVRLEKGVFEKSIVYNDDPIATAKMLENQGARWIHLVDLTGAKKGYPAQSAIAREIKNKTGLAIQTGGGLRTIDSAKEVLDHGIDRIVLGSLAVKNPEAVLRLCELYGVDRICIALDLRPTEDSYKIATHGWLKQSGTDLETLISFYRKEGIRHILATDISRDGMMQGPNLGLYKYLQGIARGITLQASGGISREDDLKALSEIDIQSAIVGKAIYEGRIQIKEYGYAR